MKMIKRIAITGTRSGMNSYQQFAVKEFLLQYPQGTELHHGDCVGVDVEVAKIAKELNFKIVCHPPIKDELRGWFPSDDYRNPLSYFARNRAIVNETDMLLVVPYQMSPQKNGGTWYTYDYAVKVNKPTIIFYRE